MIRSRRPLLAVIGNAGEIPAELTADAEAVGKTAVEAGFRLICGGRDGVMLAAARGAHQAPSYREGDTIGVLPSYRHSEANTYIDIAIPTGFGFARNMIVVSSADVVCAMSGGSGTLSEIALAWQIGRPVLAWSTRGGWAQRLAGERLDNRFDRTIEAFDDVDAMVERALVLAKRNTDEDRLAKP